MNSEFKVDGASLSHPAYSKESNSAYFYTAFSESARLHFDMFEKEDGGVYFTPTHITFARTPLNVGAKLSVEVVENGFIIKSRSITRITEHLYELDTLIKNIVKEKHDYDIKYDSEEHDFANVEEMQKKLVELRNEENA